MNDILPTAKSLQTFDNKHDDHCFKCGQLWEDTNHVLQCLSNAWDKTWTEAFKVLHTHFEKQHTPTVLTNLLCDNMAHWITNWWRIPTPQWPTPEEPIMTAITSAFHSQKNIRWDQFFHGRLSKAWLTVIEIYYQEHRPGYIFTPNHWMRTTIDAIWTFSLTLWQQWCNSSHRLNGTQTLEQKCKATASWAKEVFQETIGNTPYDKYSLTLAEFKYNDAMDTTTLGCLSCNCRSALWMECGTRMNPNGYTYFSYATSLYGVVWGGSHIVWQD